MERNKYKQLEEDILSFRPELRYKNKKGFRWEDKNCVSIIANDFASIGDVHYLYSSAEKEVGFHVHKLIYKPLYDLLKSSINNDQIGFDEDYSNIFLGYIKVNQKIDIDKDYDKVVSAFKLLFDLLNPIILDYVPQHKEYNLNVWLYWHGDAMIEKDYIEVSKSFEGFNFSDFNSSEEFKKAYKKKNGKLPASPIPASECEFTNDVKKGDIIIAFKTINGHKYIYGWGNVVSGCIQHPNKPDNNFRNVKWVEKYSSNPIMADCITNTYYFQKVTADQLVTLCNMLDLEKSHSGYVDDQLDKLLVYYKDLHKKNAFAGFDEAYKWRLLSENEGKSPKEIVSNILTYGSNLLYRYCIDTINKHLLNDEAYDEILAKLCDESVELETRLKDYNSSIDKICPADVSKPNDERSAAAVLTCVYPEKYTFFMYSKIYTPYCNYLGVQLEKRKWHTYEHFLQILAPLVDKVAKDTELKQMIEKSTLGFKQNDLLTAQTILWCMQDEWKKLSKNDDKQSIMKYQEYINLLKENYNIVLTGAPGTGKTYLAKEIAKEMGAEWKLVQFHPSYDYTDFVEGLRPIRKGAEMGFERKDGVFKEFCKRALSTYNLKNIDPFEYSYAQLVSAIEECKKNGSQYICSTLGRYDESFPITASAEGITFYRNTGSTMAKQDELKTVFNHFLKNGIRDISNKTRDDFEPLLNKTIDYSNWRGIIQKMLDYWNDIEKLPTSFVFIIDEINRGEISKIFGELFYSIDPGYRGEDGKVDTQYQNLIPKEGDADFMEDVTDIFRNGFFVPKNVYIIGTMNDIDRSVESMDFAMRRRFAWKEIKPEDRLEMLKDNLDTAIYDTAVRVMKALNDEISRTRGLGSAYQIGPAYFLRLDVKHYNGDFDKLWDMHIEILLKEYLRGYSDADKKCEEFHKIYKNAINGTNSEETEE